jgi:uncharacterized membrane protein
MDTHTEEKIVRTYPRPSLDDSEGVPSTAAIAGHPLHPAIIPFPIAFLVGAFITDIVFWQTADAFWARMSQVLIGAGILTGLLAAMLGLVDFLAIERVRKRRAGWIHALGNAAVMVLSIFNFLLRLGGDPAARVVPWGLGLSLIVALLLGVTGWFGGELVFRHKVAVNE